MSHTGAARPRGWYYGWNIVAVLVVTQIAANGMALSAFSLFLHDWSTDLKTSVSTLAAAMTPMTLVGAITGSVIGGLADRYPARWLLGGGVLGLAGFSLAVSLVTRPWQLLALYGFVLPVVIGLSTLIVASPLVARWFVRRLGLALGVTVLGVGLAGVLLPPVIAAALPVLGWRAVWRISAALMAFLVAPLVLLVVRERPTAREGLHYVGGDGAADGRHAAGHGARLSVRQIVGRRNFWLLAATYLPIVSAYFALLYNLAPFAASRGMGPQTAAMLLSVLSLTQLTATPLLGLLNDRIGARAPFLMVAGLTAAGLIFAALGAGVPALVAACALVGVGGAIWPLLAAATAVEFGAASAGQAFGLLMAFAPVTGLASFALAKLAEASGGYAPGLYLLLGFLAVAAVAALVLRERRAGHLTPAERVAAEEALPPTMA
jgi:MFS family permease